METAAAKLRIEPSGRVRLSDPDRIQLLSPSPAEVVIAPEVAGSDVGVLCADNRVDLEAKLVAVEVGSRPSVFWVAYQKGNDADINRDSVWRILAGNGLRPVNQVAIDETRSALRFRPLQPGEQFDPR